MTAPIRNFALVVLAALSAAPAFAGPGLPADSTDALAWARRVVALRRQVTSAEQAASRAAPEAAAMAEQAFIEARRLAEGREVLQDDSFRALFLKAQAAYERYHGGVHSVAVSGSDAVDLRDDAVEALAMGAPMPAPPAAADATAVVGIVPSNAGTAFLSAVAYPPAAARLIAAQAGRMRSIVGDPGGLERRGRSYFRMIDRELQRRGLPRELRYVPVIESGLNPRAVSPAGAAGLWQLMPATGAQYGLDAAGRHDPARSTVAACRLLERLGVMFDGDWQLALAAYNWGPARVQSLVARERRRLGRQPTFWDLARHMPAETRAYVPRFIAVAEAMEG